MDFATKFVTDNDYLTVFFSSILSGTIDLRIILSINYSAKSWLDEKINPKLLMKSKRSFKNFYFSRKNFETHR